MKYLLNGESCGRKEIPSYGFDEFSSLVYGAIDEGGRVSSLFAVPEGKSAVLYCVLSHRTDGRLSVFSTSLGSSYPSLTPGCPQVHTFERDIWEGTGIRPVGHPWLKSLRDPEETAFYRISGGESHEVAVGPVHAGVIEPGHFRFQCYGERIIHLEAALGYQHRGIEEALLSGPDKKTLHYMETLAGDTSIGHGLAHSLVMEGFRGISAPIRAGVIRAVALELERIANHVGDLGALAGDVGYLPVKSFCGRLRGDFLNLTARICGNRFGRNLLSPGGVLRDLSPDMAGDISRRLRSLTDETNEAVNLLWDTPTVLARFEGTGRLDREAAAALGVVGPPARACGLEMDVRSDFPTGIYRYAHVPVAVYDSGDVFARAMVRFIEFQRSSRFILDLLSGLPGGEIMTSTGGTLPANSFSVALTEGWRGEICHCALTDEKGRFGAYKIVDPSLHNWYALCYALRGGGISDFPLCNKSFNLSYCGHDL